jgi:hypothetical protein
LRRGLGFLCALLSLLTPATVVAHHGVASLGVGGLEGPGSPVETSSSATLPRGKILAYFKLDHADFERFTSARDDESKYSSFCLFGLGYGIRSWLSAYVFMPYNIKRVEDGSSDSAGFADLSLMGVLGFKYDDGIKLAPENESLDDLEDWHFTLYGGLSLPTGDPNTRTRKNEIDPGMSLGFGKPTFSVGLTATKPFRERFTWIGETSYLFFQENRYADGNRTRFGDEFRLNSALTYRLVTISRWKFRLDANIEANYLRLGRDCTNGAAERATGGQILYLLPGARVYWRNTSLGLGVKLPTWTNLNEEREQQGAEGKEHYRLLATFSLILF